MIAEGSATVITGSLGGGKTLAAVGEIMEHLSKGGTVVTNVALYVDKISDWMRDEFGVIFDPKRLVILDQSSIRNFHDLAIRGSEDSSVLMVLDEAALDVNAHDWASLPKEIFNFVVLVRKLGIDLVFIAQDASDIDKQVRKKFQREIHCRSLMKMDFLGLPMGLPVFIRVIYLLSLGTKPWRDKVKFSWKGEGWGFFNSRALHGEKAQLFAALPQAASGKLQRVEYKPLPYYAAAALVTLISTITTSCLLVNSLH